MNPSSVDHNTLRRHGSLLELRSEQFNTDLGANMFENVQWLPFWMQRFVSIPHIIFIFANLDLLLTLADCRKS